MKDKISIVAMASISALGNEEGEIWQSYQKKSSLIKEEAFGRFKALVSKLKKEDHLAVEELRKIKNYRDLDPSVLMAVLTARKAFAKTDWFQGEFGINIGSSRGATTLFEKYHKEFLDDEKGQVSTLSSPTTTLGNLSSWVGHDLQAKGPVISHSIACSTALHGLLNGIAWINSGMSERFMVGGSEASNTAFTLAQMKSLKIYAEEDNAYPCRSLDMDKSRNTMVLGEGAAVFCLERGSVKNALAVVEGIGYATEPLLHNISISTNADCFQTSMAMALKGVEKDEVDVIVAHAPGTIKGDRAEYNAIRKVFGTSIPALTSNKWIIGHSLGASGGLSLEMAILMMKHQQFIGIPFGSIGKSPQSIRKVLVNAVGFGGNAVSVLLSLE